jgi:hypothetical protein
MKERINKLLYQLNQDLFEREEAIKLALLATLSGESIFFLGPPGVAKSLISRRVKDIFKNGKSFEYLMNRFSTPDEIFGPIAISKLKNEDKYERKVESYLPSADVVFLDEIWKAGPSIQNALLTVINEKKYRNGAQEIDIPLKGLISASNELPAKGEGLEALWDRFIIRYIVENITDENHFNAFLKKTTIDIATTIDEDLKFSTEEYKQCQPKIDAIDVPDEILGVISFIRYNIAEYNTKEENKAKIYISDRRWKKIVRFLKTAAFLNDRKEINLGDCFLIAYTLWDEVEQIDFVKEAVTIAIKKHGYSYKFDITTFEEQIEKLKLDIKNHSQVTKKVEYFVPKVYDIDGNKYYKIKGFHFPWIAKSDFDNIKTYNQVITLYQEDNYRQYHYRQYYLHHNKQFYIKKSENKIFIKELYDYNREKYTEYDLEVDTNTKEVVETSRPDKRIIADWDKTVQNLLTEIDEVIEGIENYKNENDRDLKDNLFVPKKLTILAEEGVNKALIECKKTKTIITQIKKDYDKL